MSSNFFIRNSKSGLKRKASGKHPSKNKQRKNEVNVRISKSLDSDEISSDDESVKHHSEDESDDNNIITAQEKKVSLAKKYLEEIEREEKERLESSDLGLHKSVVGRLRDDLLSQAGKLSKKVADFIPKPEVKDIVSLRCKEHNLSITCIALTPDNKVMFSGSKDATIVKWSLDLKTKMGVIPSKHKNKTGKEEHLHNSSILGLAVSFDSQYLASCDESSVIRIWNVTTLDHVHSFKGHRSTVTSLAFCYESNHLYSCSKDRSVRIWNLDEMSFVEALFGHQTGATDLDVLKKDRAVSAGGCDNTLRVWKVQEESQLIFNGHQKSIDRVRRLDQQHFVSCGDDGQVCVWGVLKKKPLSTIQQAHGIDLTNSEPNWITSLACFPNSDLIVSGSCNGFLKFWKCEENFRNVIPLFSVPVVGFINDLVFSKDEKHLVVAVGQEHRLGRWISEKKARNSLLIISLRIPKIVNSKHEVTPKSCTSNSLER